MPQKKPKDFIPVKDFPKGHKHYGKPRCQKWSYRQGRQCMGFDMGNGSCRVHNGKAQSGIANPNYKHGKYSKTLPKRLIENYELSSKDPDYLKLQGEIALVDSRLMELTSNIDGRSSSKIFDDLIATVKAMEQAQNDIVRSQTIIDVDIREKARIEANQRFLGTTKELSNIVKTGAKEWYIWKDITNLIEARRRLVDTERKLLVDMQMLVNTQDVMALLDAVMESVRRNVTDRDTRQRIQSDFIRLTAK